MRGRSRQVTSSAPSSLSPSSCFSHAWGERTPSGWTKQQISTLALEEAGGHRGKESLHMTLAHMVRHSLKANIKVALN